VNLNFIKNKGGRLPMYDSNGVQNGIEWSIKYLGDRDFQLTVGDRIEKYTCQYPTIFGIDVSDVNDINRKLDEMQEKVEKELKGEQ
jgi:hypothetical protein